MTEDAKDLLKAAALCVASLIVSAWIASAALDREGGLEPVTWETTDAK